MCSLCLLVSQALELTFVPNTNKGSLSWMHDDNLDKDEGSSSVTLFSSSSSDFDGGSSGGERAAKSWWKLALLLTNSDMLSTAIRED